MNQVNSYNGFALMTAL